MDNDDINQIRKETAAKLGLPENTSMAKIFRKSVEQYRLSQGLPPSPPPSDASIHIIRGPNNDN
jgi:hypothetical protein